MKKIAYLIILFIVPLLSKAQELSVKSFAEKPNDLTARIEARVDNNGQPTAVVKVLLAAEGAEFEGLVVDRPIVKTGEYWVFMADGAKRLTVRLPGYLPLTVTFSDYDIKSLAQKTTYELVVAGLKAQVQDTVTIKDTIYLPSNPIEDKFSQKEGELTIMATAMPTRSLTEGLKQAAWGITVGRGDTWGWYVNATSNFVFEKNAGTVSGTDGLTEGGALIFFNNVRSVSFHQATGGVSYRISDHLKLMLGAGYGLRNVYAQSEEGKYYQIGGGGGVSLEAGICLSVSILSFEASVCSPALSGISARVGLGIKL